jgi:hypothetical protein
VFLVLLLVVAATAGRAERLAATSQAADFAGRWVLESAEPEREGYDQFWLGMEMTVTQDATSLVIRRLNPLPERTATFVFGGAESQNAYDVAGKREVKDSRATWNGDLLLISTDTTTEDGRRWLSNILRWSLEADDALVVGDTEICGSGECPSIITTLTFRKQ